MLTGGKLPKLAIEIRSEKKFCCSCFIPIRKPWNIFRNQNVGSIVSFVFYIPHNSWVMLLMCWAPEKNFAKSILASLQSMKLKEEGKVNHPPPTIDATRPTPPPTLRSAYDQNLSFRLVILIDKKQIILSNI